jgi:uncharacterized protein (DUF302 family)
MSQALTFEIELDLSIEETEELVTAALKSEGFGVLTRIDVRKTLREKLGADFRPYIILGACNPPLAHRALLSDPRIGIMLPCNVTLEADEETVRVCLADPEMMLSFGEFGRDPGLASVAADARQRMERVAEALRSRAQVQG